MNMDEDERQALIGLNQWHQWLAVFDAVAVAPSGAVLVITGPLAEQGHEVLKAWSVTHGDGWRWTKSVGIDGDTVLLGPGDEPRVRIAREVETERWIPPSQRVGEPGPCTPMAHCFVSGSSSCRCGEVTRTGDCLGWKVESRT